MRARGLGAPLVLAVAIIATALVPTSAAAKSGYFVSGPGNSAILQLKSSNGYRLNLLTFGGKRLFLIATRNDRAKNESVSYFVPQRGSEHGEIRASLGALGRISLRFRPSAPPRPGQPEPGCKGRLATTQEGWFEGVLRFRGERGFTATWATKVRGQLSRSFRRVCKRPPEEWGSPEPKGLSVTAYSKRDPEAPWFSVSKFASGSRFGALGARYSAGTYERRGRISINRSVYASADASTFSVSPPVANPTVASAEPPLPFTGAATFERAAGAAPIWSGDLRVDLPGLGSVPLTGSTVLARFCRGVSCACPPNSACAFTFAVAQGRKR